MELTAKFLRVGSHFCPNCDHFWTEESLWCSHCQGLFKLQPLEAVELPFCRLHYWIDWRPETKIGSVWARYLRLLKYERNPQAWTWLAKEFVKRMKSAVDFPQVVFTAAPSRHSRDHAHHFASGLAAASGAEFVPSAFRLVDFSPQKEKSSKERSQRSLLLIRPLPAAKTLIFVDDVLSTGSTALAAHQALGNPNDFHVWTLAYRRLSCDD